LSFTAEEQLKAIRLKQEIPYSEDCERIRDTFKQRGYSISLLEAHWLWSTYSDKFAASWLFLPESDDEVFDAVKQYFDEDDQ
jgi:hypothetical protein